MKSPKSAPEGKEGAGREPAAVLKSRRSFLPQLGLGAMLAAMVAQGYALLRALVPNVLYEAPPRAKLGAPDQLAEGVTFFEDKHLFVVRERNTFYAISAICTHLGCTVKLISLNQPKKVQIRGQQVEERREFHCPCHGSKYHWDGSNYAGPAPKPLAWYRLEVSPDDGQLIVDFSQPVNRSFRLTV